MALAIMRLLFVGLFIYGIGTHIRRAWLQSAARQRWSRLRPFRARIPHSD